MKMDGARLAVAVLLTAFGVVASGSLLSAAGTEEEKDEPETEVVFTKDHPLARPDPSTALVYVLRPTSMGFAVKSYFFVDDDIVGINRGSSYFYARIAPGKHVFWSKSENVDALEQEVEAGATYYIQQRVRMGGFRARTKLEALSSAEGEEALAKCAKNGTLTNKGRDKGKELAARYRENANEDLDRRAKEAEEQRKRTGKGPS